MVVNDRVLSVQKPSDIKPWLAAIPEINLIADVDPVFLFGGDASEIQPDLWRRLAKEMYLRYKKYDGFVVTHGVDTILYTAPIISYMLQPLGKPIIFTGSPLSAEVSRGNKQDLSGLISNYNTLGVKANLINAIQVATMDIGEVALMFGNRLLRGMQAIKSDSPSFSLFEAYHDGLIGKVDFGIKLFDTVKRRTKAVAKLQDKLEENICLLQLYPGVQAALLKGMIQKGCRGIIIRSFNTNLFPDSFRKILDIAYQQKIPIVAHNPFALELKKKKREYILINNLTFETTFVKFMWALGQTRDLGKLRMLMWDQDYE